jgi:predicted enzyme related to lactoylglutathione lyase
MQQTHYIIFYVNDPLKSGEFYEALLDKKPDVATPGFAKFTLTPDLMLGLWAKDDVTPMLAKEGVGGELNFTVESQSELEALFAEWKLKGVEVIQEPYELDFGFSFVGVDPDENRLRVVLLKV